MVDTQRNPNTWVRDTCPLLKNKNIQLYLDLGEQGKFMGDHNIWFVSEGLPDFEHKCMKQKSCLLDFSFHHL